MKNLHTHIARSIIAVYPATRVAAVDVTDTAIQACLGSQGQLTFRGSAHPYDGDYVLSSPGMPDIRIPVKHTLAEARAILGPEMSLSKRDGEYRVNYMGGGDVTASYTNDLEDAINTGKHMRDNRKDLPHWTRTAHGIYRAGTCRVQWGTCEGNDYWEAFDGDVHRGTIFVMHYEGDPRFDAMILATKVHEPVNPSCHPHMIALGYTHQHTPADFDDGDAENGPGTHGHDCFDTYTSSDDYVIFDAQGHFAHYEKRDLELEKMLDANSTAGGDVAIPRSK